MTFGHAFISVFAVTWTILSVCGTVGLLCWGFSTDSPDTDKGRVLLIVGIALLGLSFLPSATLWVYAAQHDFWAKG